MSVVLVVDDESEIRRLIALVLRNLGCEVVEAQDGLEGIVKLTEGRFDLVITDLRMPKADGYSVLRAARSRHPMIPAIVLTGHGLLAECVTSIRAGAANFLTKPVHRVELEQVVKSTLSEARSEEGGRELSSSRPHVAMIGESPTIVSVLNLVAQVAHTEATVLLIGETGTGKEVVARLIHGVSGRSPFVVVNCGALPEGLIESELFGHARGAFTGATDKREGRFVQAHGGTLFLDEIGELPHPVQAKLLRVLQEREVTPLGEPKSVSVDVRIVAATHRNLESMVENGTFRQDLFYRLNVFPIEIPSLRQRSDDISVLARHFLEMASGRLRKTVTLGEDACRILESYSWPGNVRELENLIERLAILDRDGVITREDLPAKLTSSVRQSLAPVQAKMLGSAGEGAGIDLARTLEQIEEQLIRDALRKAGGNKSMAAKLLGVNRTTLLEKLKRKSIRDSA